MASIFGIWGLLLRFRLFFELLYTTHPPDSISDKTTKNYCYHGYVVLLIETCCFPSEIPYQFMVSYNHILAFYVFCLTHTLFIKIWPISNREISKLAHLSDKPRLPKPKIFSIEFLWFISV